MATLVLEQIFENPVTPDELNDSARRLDQCLEAFGARWMRSYLSQDRLRMICEFEAADAEQVRSAYRSSGLPFERCWVADMYAREKPSEGY